jgi:L-fuconolactonase
MFDRDDWLAGHTEEIIEPERPITDPHHHLWSWQSMKPYLLDQLHADTGSGHRVEKTVYIECGWSYHKDGPDHLRSLGESVFVAKTAAEARLHPERAQIAGHIAHTDMTRADVGETLDLHLAASDGLLRGIRHQGACESDPALLIRGHAPEGLFLNADFQRGVRLLGARGLTFDCWNYHHQIPQVTALARACPETILILDHFGTPLGVGGYEGRRAEIMAQWKTDIAELARCENVCAKLGGLAMPDNGWKYNEQDKPATSDQIVADQADWYHYTIEQFGPDRCMFESNFPVDRASVSYHVLWNAFKKMAQRYSDTEKDALFRQTANRVYRL